MPFSPAKITTRMQNYYTHAKITTNMLHNHLYDQTVWWQNLDPLRRSPAPQRPRERRRPGQRPCLPSEHLSIYLSIYLDAYIYTYIYMFLYIYSHNKKIRPLGRTWKESHCDADMRKRCSSVGARNCPQCIAVHQ
jgi:hypothetical protein